MTGRPRVPTPCTVAHVRAALVLPIDARIRPGPEWSWHRCARVCTLRRPRPRIGAVEPKTAETRSASRRPQDGRGNTDAGTGSPTSRQRPGPLKAHRCAERSRSSASVRSRAGSLAADATAAQRSINVSGVTASSCGVISMTVGRVMRRVCSRADPPPIRSRPTPRSGAPDWATSSQPYLDPPQSRERPALVTPRTRAHADHAKVGRLSSPRRGRFRVRRRRRTGDGRRRGRSRPR